MAVTDDQVHGMAQAYVTALAKVPGKDKLKLATKAIGDNFNQLLGLAKEAKPDVDGRLWPAPVQFAPVGSATCNYADLEIYANQIMAHFPQALAA